MRGYWPCVHREENEKEQASSIHHSENCMEPKQNKLLEATFNGGRSAETK